MIEMSRGQDDLGVADPGRFDEVRPARRPTATVAPGAACVIEPSTVRQTADFDTVRPATALTDAGSTLESDLSTDFRPITGVKPAHLRLDGIPSPIRRDGAVVLAE
jgi:hypothetical protein